MAPAYEIWHAIRNQLRAASLVYSFPNDLLLLENKPKVDFGPFPAVAAVPRLGHVFTTMRDCQYLKT